MRFLVSILFVVPFVSLGQSKATIHFDIQNSTTDLMDVSLWGDITNPKVLFSEYYVSRKLENGKYVLNYDLFQATTIKFYHLTADETYEFQYSFYLSPGDDIYFSLDEKMGESSISVTGKGSENNQPMIQPLHHQFSNFLFSEFNEDTLPARSLNALCVKNESNRQILEEYSAKCHPTEQFIANETSYIRYFPLTNYLTFKESRKFAIGNAYYRNEEAWKKIEDSLQSLTPLNNDAILYVTDYNSFIGMFLDRLKERAMNNPKLFESYTSNEEEKQLFYGDNENLLREKIIATHFSGRTAEFLYAYLFQENTNDKDDNLPEIFERFKLKYPNSVYIFYLEQRVQSIE